MSNVANLLSHQATSWYLCCAAWNGSFHSSSTTASICTNCLTHYRYTHANSACAIVPRTEDKLKYIKLLLLAHPRTLKRTHTHKHTRIHALALTLTSQTQTKRAQKTTTAATARTPAIIATITAVKRKMKTTTAPKIAMRTTTTATTRTTMTAKTTKAKIREQRSWSGQNTKRLMVV